jgi:hypothetical protein
VETHNFSVFANISTNATKIVKEVVINATAEIVNEKEIVETLIHPIINTTVIEVNQTVNVTEIVSENKTVYMNLTE